MKIKSGIFLILIAFLSCKKEMIDLEYKTEISTSYTYKIHDYNNEKNQTPIAYYGDTIRYSLHYKSEVEIRFIYVYFHIVGEDGKFEVYPHSSNYAIDVSKINAQNKEDSSQYIHPLDQDRFNYLWRNPGNEQLTAFIFDYYDTLGLIKSDTLPPFILKRSLEIENHQRLYNIANKEKGYVRGFKFYGGRELIQTDFLSCQGSTCMPTNDARLLMVNISNDDYLTEWDSATTKDFINGWLSPGNNHTFAKVNAKIIYDSLYPAEEVKFDDIKRTWHIMDIYRNNLPRLTKIEGPNVGDIYVFRYVPEPHSTLINSGETSYYTHGDIYGIIEITHIEDDGLSSNTGGNEFDYIEFRIKSFGTSFRFE